MNKFFFLSIIGILFVFSNNSTAQVISVNLLKSVEGKEWDIASGFVTDKDQNYWFVAGFEDTIRVDKDTLISTGKRDVLLAKCDTAGNLLFAKQIRGAEYQHVSSAYVDKNNNLLVAGSYREKAFFDKDSITALGYMDNFVAKYSATGNLQWVFSFAADCRGNELFVFTDKKNNLYLAGTFYYDMHLGDSVYYSRGEADIFIVQLDTKGNPKKFCQLGDTGKDVLNHIITHKNDEFILTGSFTNEIRIGKDKHIALGAEDFFVAKTDDKFKNWWSYCAGSAYTDYGYRVAATQAGEIFVTGDYEDMMYFGKDSLVSVGSSDIFMMKFKKNGTVEWKKSIGGFSTDNTCDIYVSNKNNIYLAGTYRAQLNAGTKTITARDPLNDAFIGKFDKNGEAIWLETIGGTGPDYIRNITTGMDNYLYLTGGFDGNFIIGTDSVNSQNSSDLFVTRFFDCDFAQQLPQMPDTSFCASGTLTAAEGFTNYLWNHINNNQNMDITETGNYIIEATEMHGCKTSDTLFVEIFPEPETELGADTAICYGQLIELNAGSGLAQYEWTDGSTGQYLPVNQTGVYGVRVTNTDGCSTTDSISVTVNPLPEVELGGAQTITAGQTLLVNAGNFATYLWHDGSYIPVYTFTTEGLPAGVYPVSVQVTDYNGCVNADSMLIIVENMVFAVNAKTKAGNQTSNNQPETTTSLTTNKNTDVQIYPNPSDGKFYIELPPSEQTCTVSVYTTDFKIIYLQQFTVNDTKQILEITLNTKGVYYVQTDRAGTQTIQKMIVL